MALPSQYLCILVEFDSIRSQDPNNTSDTETSLSVSVCFFCFHNTTTHNCCWPITFLPQSKMLRQISLMRLTLPPSRKMILNKTLKKNVSLRSISTRAQYASYFKTLDLPISASKEQVRRRYIELAKQHHPDAGADGAEEFAKVDAAYKGLQKKFKEDEEREKAMEGEYGLYYQEKKRMMEEEEVDNEEDDEDKYPHITHV